MFFPTFTNIDEAKLVNSIKKLINRYFFLLCGGSKPSKSLVWCEKNERVCTSQVRIAEILYKYVSV